ncbi:MAG: hypothetical protein ACRDVG_11350 [Jatrophihabitantaceae bacterium]
MIMRHVAGLHLREHRMLGHIQRTALPFDLAQPVHDLRVGQRIQMLDHRCAHAFDYMLADSSGQANGGKNRQQFTADPFARSETRPTPNSLRPCSFSRPERIRGPTAKQDQCASHFVAALFNP